MKRTARIVLAGLAALGFATAHADPITYEGDLTIPDTVTGLVGGFGYERDVADDLDFWRFTGNAGDAISIRVTRRDPGLDPVMDLYLGETTADDSEFRAGMSWGGLQFLLVSDDVVDPPNGGPFQDPFAIFRLPSTGIYTIAVGGAASLDEGPYPYELALQQVVPAPGTAWLLFAGVGALGWTWRSARTARGTA
ncbi:MAG TPA: hypothetical protein VGI14_19335 [Casimicrobiaceae bacterium]|jgi:hypothetical protein